MNAYISENVPTYRILSDEQINKLETAIKSAMFVPVSDPREPSVSVQYYYNGNQLWKQMCLPETPTGAYDIFASNGMGYVSFALYKSLSGEIYVVHVSINDIAKIYEINETKFHYFYAM